jgi:UDP-N-acetylglucosamine--N-acetylmuramyl-(pentapeptide) pyrophosphoryl-undecaprenol N-acetylglucosamine transferase
MKILFCGGGTSGHVTPALAIAEEIKRRYADVNLLFVGREGGYENTAIKQYGIPLKTLSIKGLKRSWSWENAKRICLAAKAYGEAKRIVADFSPDVVVGTGGYVSWPVLRAAQKMKLPTVIHESNAVPGLVTRLLAGRCDILLLNYEKALDTLPRVKSYKVVGNPLLSDFSTISRKRARKELKLEDDEIYILSFGGSGGAQRLNEVIISLMKKRSVSADRIKHLHATGKRYFEGLKNDDLKDGARGCRIIPFINDMPRQLAAADIVISRSGAMTLSELSRVGACAILIPSPNVSDNHQYKNARVISDAGGCLLIEEEKLTEELLCEKLELLIKDREIRESLSEKIKKFASPSASEDSVDEIWKLLSK